MSECYDFPAISALMSRKIAEALSDRSFTAFKVLSMSSRSTGFMPKVKSLGNALNCAVCPWLCSRYHAS